MLRAGDLEARGLPTNAGEAKQVLKSIWHHQDFYLDAERGDLFEETDVAPDPQHASLRCRWRALLLCRPVDVYHSEFHVKPTEPDQLRSSTHNHDLVGHSGGDSKSSNALQRARTTAKSQRECTEWLEAIMRASPDVRARSNLDLWAEAQQRWLGTLTHRAFFSARQKAMDNTRAFAWGAAGAPKKSQPRNHRGK
jgi:hypothetical protein